MIPRKMSELRQQRENNRGDAPTGAYDILLSFRTPHLSPFGRLHVGLCIYTPLRGSIQLMTYTSAKLFIRNGDPSESKEGDAQRRGIEITFMHINPSAATRHLPLEKGGRPFECGTSLWKREEGFMGQN